MKRCAEVKRRGKGEGALRRNGHALEARERQAGTASGTSPGFGAMRAMLYARYSSDLQREASIEDQFRNCERVCERNDWPIVARYADEAMSGAKADRPQYQALLEAVKRGECDVIVVDEVSRLWRDQEEQWRAVKQLRFCRVHILGVCDGINTQAGGYGLLLSIRGAMNEEARRETAMRTHRGQEGQVRKGFSAGGRVYGYRSVPQYHPTEKDHLGRPVVLAVRREIDPEQAKWIRWIYERYDESWSPRSIAQELNARGVPPPGAAWNRRQRQCKGWAQSAILGDEKRGFGILRNPLYAGVLVWNRTQRMINPENGGRCHAPRPESDRVKVEAPELRIVPDELWRRVQTRLRDRRRGSGPTRSGQRRGGRGPKYPFSGLFKCAICGASYVMVNDRNYGCAAHREHGSRVCDNRLVVKRAIAESRCLEAIKRDLLLKPEYVERFGKKVAELQRKAARSPRPVEEPRVQLERVEREIDNVVKAVKAGRYSPSLEAELVRLETGRERLLRSSRDEASGRKNVTRLFPRLTEVYRGLVQDLESVIHQNPDRARGLLRVLVGEKVLLHPRGDYLEAELRGNYPGLLKLAGDWRLCGTEERT